MLFIKMLFNVFFVIVLTQFKAVINVMSVDEYLNSYVQYGAYRGEKFPHKYLNVDDAQTTKSDISYYVKTLSRVIDYFALAPNDTDPNVALGTYLMNAVIKRTLIDYSNKIENEEKSIMLDIIHKSENLISHYIYNNYRYGPPDLGYLLSRLFIHDDSLVYSIGKFNNNTMVKWINSNVNINKYIEEMDNITLPKEKYAKLVTTMDDYYLITDSDTCISSLSTHPLPLKMDQDLKQCRLDNYCKKRVFKMPTVAYALSHQYIYVLGLAQTRRCYIISEEIDKVHMDILCANMYRETVYLARRGYFYRDLFLEHIALCAMLGYEEFHRRNWFQKAASWIDEDGCMVENTNFEINRTALYLAKAKDTKEAKKIRNIKALQMLEECHNHQMALVMCVLAHGIRHAAHKTYNTL